MKDLSVKTPVPSHDNNKKEENEKKDDYSLILEENAEYEKLSDDDKVLKEDIDLCIQVLQDNNETVYLSALNQLRARIKASTTSVTAVPKPLKFLMPHYSTLKELHEKLTGEAKTLCADIVSVLAMAIPAAAETRESLKFKLLGSLDDIGCWGHEYVSHLTNEIATEWNEGDSDIENLERLVNKVIPYHISHNAEIEACDLVMAIERSDLLEKHMTEETFQRVANYISSCAPYNLNHNEYYAFALKLYEKFGSYCEALRLAISMRDISVVKTIFLSCEDATVRKQLAFMIARSHFFSDINKIIDDDSDEYDDLNHILSNEHLNSNLLNLARDLDIMEPKTPIDIFKNESGNTLLFSVTGIAMDSAKKNLASSFVNGFVNAGFGNDTFFSNNGMEWLYKNKGDAMISAMASLGLIHLWDVDSGLSDIDKYMYSSDTNIKAGALLACGIVSCGVHNDCEPALALLGDYVHSENIAMRIASVIGLGIAYAGTCQADTISLLIEVMSDVNAPPEVVCFSAFSCSLIVVSPMGSVVSAILNTLHSKTEEDFKNVLYIFLPLALGVCYLGRNDESDAIIEALMVLPDPFKSLAALVVEVCSYAGTGNVLVVQSLLHICSEHYDINSSEIQKSKQDKVETENKTSTEKAQGKPDKEQKLEFTMAPASRQAIAVLGIALIAMGEDISTDMAFRMFGHLFRYSEPIVKSAVPLAMGLISVSNPKMDVIEVLGKYSHDSDPDVHRNAIFALGLVAASTNNTRVANMLRMLENYHAKLPDTVFVIRMANGLVHLAKSTLTLSPFYNERLLMRHESVAGLLSVLFAFLSAKSTILGSYHYMMYYLVCAMQPRMLATFDENLAPLAVHVRVGQAVDVVGQAGKPKTITGFQTHITPVLLGPEERAELATDQYIPLTPVFEGCVILRKNPDFVSVAF